MEEELHHVILGEELGDGREFVGTDLFAGLVDLVLPLGLPELVGPAEGIVGAKCLRRKGCEELAQLDLVVESNGEIKYRVVASKNAGKCETGKSAGEIVAIAGAEFRREFFAFLQSHGDDCRWPRR